MEVENHRRAQILNALYELFEPLREDSEDPYPDSFFDSCSPPFFRVKTVQKRYVHWTQLDQQGAIPCILLSFDEKLRRRDGGANTEFAALGEKEEILPVVCDVVLKESKASTEFSGKPITDQVSDAIYTIERLINGTPDLGIEGVCRTSVPEVDTSAGRISALKGTPFEVVRNHIAVTHIYPSNTSV